MAGYDRLYGLMGQGLGMPKIGRRVFSFTASAAGSGQLPAVPFPCVAEAYLWGAGGSGVISGGVAGAGAEAVMQRFNYGPSVTASYTIGAGGLNSVGQAGGDSTLTVNGQTVALAHGGGSSSADPALGGTGGIGLLSRAGGNGHIGAGSPGAYGGRGGTAASTGGGGGSGGFSDLAGALSPFAGAQGGDGSSTSGNSGSWPGGGASSGGTSTSQHGGDGGLVVIFREI